MWLLGLLAALTLGNSGLYRVAHLALEVTAQVLLLQQGAAFLNGIDQLAIIQLAHIAGRAQILTRLTVDVTCLLIVVLLLVLVWLLATGPAVLQLLLNRFHTVLQVEPHRLLQPVQRQQIPALSQGGAKLLFAHSLHKDVSAQKGFGCPVWPVDLLLRKFRNNNRASLLLRG
ncbi:MAG: hypothetical protein R3287_11160 [Anderseniella sp.]|nr:hypothetical protein [Anderseniella sp.]